MTATLKTTQPFVVIAVAAALVIAVTIAWPMVGVPLLINATNSEPLGLYRVKTHKAREYVRGMLVVFAVPAAFERLVTDRGWMSPGWRLVKGIGAIAGDRVCVTDAAVAVNGVPIGPVAAKDTEGQRLPRYRGCEILNDNEFLPLSTHHAKSFDGRYMGPQPLTAILGEAIPVWTF